MGDLILPLLIFYISLEKKNLQVNSYNIMIKMKYKYLIKIKRKILQ